MEEMRGLVDKDASHACSRQTRRHEAILDRDSGLIRKKQYAGASGHVRKVKSIFAMVVMAAFFVPVMFALPIMPSSHMPEGPSTPIRTVALTPHNPIVINGDAGFTGPNSTTGITKGGGTVSDPYVIEGWEISFWTVDGISISSADVHFVIQDCYVHDLGQNGMAILLYFCSNCTIRNCAFSNDYIGIWLGSSSGNHLVNNTCSNCLYGIDLRAIYFIGSSDNNILINNTCSNNGCGIYLESSNDNTLIDNTCSNNGIRFVWSSDNTLSDNSIINGGISVNGVSLSYWNTHSIDASNTVNGKPVFYLKNQNGVTVPSGAGQVIIANCTNIVVENQNLSNTDCGISIGFSSDVLVDNNTCSSNRGDGIALTSSNNNTISNNTCSNNLDGIELCYSTNNNTISNNTCCANEDRGIHLDIANNNTLNNNNCSSNKNNGVVLDSGSSNNLLFNNTCDWNEQAGMLLDIGINNTLTGNNCSSNYWSGIYLFTWSKDNTLISNICCSNNHDGIGLVESDHNEISLNLICNNVGYGINISSGPDNHIWNNTFIGNNGAGSIYSASHIQAYDDGTNNSWNSTDGYGNYWSDLTKPDTNHDGIVDWSYNLTGSSSAKDHYPQTTTQVPIPEFGMMPFVVVALMTVIVLAGETRRRRTR